MTRTDPPADCALCPRLVTYRAANRRELPDHFNNPVGIWGDPASALLVVGLAPGLNGANRTGQPFTGDASGDLLLETLAGVGFARFEHGAAVLRDCAIINAVACVPPKNRPLGAEIANCRPYLRSAIDAGAPVILALGRVAHEAVLRAMELRPAANPFAHGGVFRAEGRVLIGSYHPSRYNVQTGRLTPEMFREVVAEAARATGAGQPESA